jgi:quercetin dioxygenase-like cupin family protein
MNDLLVIAPRGGEIVGDAPDRRVEILSDHDALHATWSRFAPGRDGADLHVHHRHTDLFYVLEGELTLRLGPGGDPVTVPAGTLACMPPLVVHGFRNGGGAEVRYLNMHAPGRGFAGFMRALRDGHPITYDQHAPPADGGRSPTEAVIGGEGAAAEAGGLHMTLLADLEAIAIAEVRGAPGAAQAQHSHRAHGESLYVLEGELAVLAGARELHAPAGSWVRVPPGVPHALACPGPEPVRFLDLHAPGAGFGALLQA